jgi:hypothetical protein
MKKITPITIILFLCYLLSAELVNFNHLQFLNNEHFTLESYDQPHFTICHKDLIVNIYENNEREIIYENSQRNSNIENTRDTLLRLHFNDTYPHFKVMNEDYYFNSSDATWIDSITAEISLPGGIYNIYTNFFVESQFKFVIRYNVDLTIGTGLHEVWIEHDEATNILELNSCDSAGEPFDMCEKYYTNFTFRILNGYSDYLYISFINNNNQIMTLDILGDLDFVAGELNFDEENVHITQYGPVQEITSNQSFSNEPTDYYSQQILLQIPEVNENLKIGIANTDWYNFGETPLYFISIYSNDLLECFEDQWSTNLYMMYHNYEQCGLTSMIFLINIENNNWQEIYYVAPFHCIDDKIGSFWNSIPIIVDYLSPNGEQLIFGEAPIFLESHHYYFDNLLFIGIESMGFNKEIRAFDFNNSTFILTDSNGNIIEEGELSNLWELNLPEDIYTLTVEDNNFNLAGLPGMCTLTNYFNTALELPKSPFINSLSIFNEDNKPINRLEYNENATILFSVADMEYIDSLLTYFPVVTDSVKVFCRLHDEEDWQEYETEFIDEFPELGWTFGKVFSTDLSEVTATDSVVYDLKIYFEDNEENYTELILEPAFVVGDFNATSLFDEEIQNNNSEDYCLISNFPNPFNPSTIISFLIPENSKVELTIYNLKGQRVKTLVNEILPAGEYSTIWDGSDSNSTPVSSGIYFYQLKAGSEFSKNTKMLLLK